MTMKTIRELTSEDTTTTAVRGSSRTAYNLEPTKWVEEINEAAQLSHYFAQGISETVVPQGHKDAIFPYRSKFLKSVRTGGSGGDWQAVVSEGVAVNYTKLDNMDGVHITPASKNGGVAISYDAIRTNRLDLVKFAKDELTYHKGEKLDKDVAYAYATATAATSTASGAQTIYGGDAQAESALDAGDVLTTAHIAEGIRKLKSKVCKYWTPSSPAAEQTSSAEKNPWTNTKLTPFVIYISSAQEEELLNDSQFVNASEYGSNDVLLNGEIGKYLGVKVVVTENTPSFTTSTQFDGGSNAGVAGHRCILTIPNKAMGLAWGLKPKIHIFDYPSQLEKRLIIEMSYAAGVIHSDAIVFIDVADQ